MKTTRALTMVGACMVTAMNAQAVEQRATEGREIVLEEVTVQARRTDESLQRVPVAVTAITSEALEQKMIHDARDLKGHVPTLVVAPSYTGPNESQFGLRGVRGGTKVYFAEVWRDTGVGVIDALFDMASVQTLTGPQGTLFGQQSTQGAILFVPQKPKQQLEASVEARLGNYNAQAFTGMLNVPLGNTFSMRVGAYSSKHDGYIKNLGSGHDAFSEDRQAVRISALWRPADWFENYTILDWYKADEIPNAGFVFNQDPCPAVPDAVARRLNSCTMSGGPGTVNAGQTSLYDLVQQQIALEPRAMVRSDRFGSAYEAKVKGATNTTTLDFSSAFGVKNIAHVRNESIYNRTNVNTIDLPYNIVNNTTDTDYLSEELQLFGKLWSERIDWRVGAFYSNKKPKATDKLSRPLDAAGETGYLTVANIAPAPGFAVYPVRSEGINYGGDYTKSRAAFAHLGIKLLDDLTLSGGFRRSKDESLQTSTNYTQFIFWQGLAAHPSCFTPSGCARASNPVASRSYVENEGDNWELGLEYRMTNTIFAYFTTREGYKPGVTSLANGGAAPPELNKVLPENVRDYEVGLKADWYIGDMPVRTNLAVWNTDYKNMQRRIILVTNPLAGPSQYTVNAAKTTMRGASLEFAFSPIQDLVIDGFYSYDDAKYDQFVVPPITSTPIPLPESDFSGLPVPAAPKNTANISANYHLPFDSTLGSFSIFGQYSWRSEQSFEDQPKQAALALQDGYGVADFRLTWAGIAQSTFDLTFYVQNAFDEEYVINTQSSPASGWAIRFFGEPRTFGAQLNYKFGH